jgi:N-acetylglutamate synthase-like GNAT family acetyltransferase
MLARLSVSTEERLLPVVRGFGREVACAVGLSHDEERRLADALEEVARFVREHAYPGDPSGTIEVALEATDRGIGVAVHDWGRPLTSVDRPPELARLGGLVEDLRLINLGSDGKRLSFVWPATLPGEVAAAAPDTAARMPAGEIVVRAARPEDAEPIAQLLYQNYALTYLHSDFYRPRWLREELLAGRVVSSVAVHGDEIVGHHALMRAADAAAAETGVAVVAPAYRGLGIFGRLSEDTLERARALGLRAVYGQAVTMHPYSQRAELAHGYRETALCVAAFPGRVTMRGIGSTIAPERRTALMVSFLPLQREPPRATLPQRYRERLLETYAALDLPAPAPSSPAPAARRITVAREHELRSAVLTIGDWDDALATEAITAIRTLLAEHVDVIYADLDLEAIGDPDAAVEAMRGQGFSYAGLRLHGPGDHDHLRLQRLNTTEAELEAVATASAAGQALVDYVLADLDGVAHPSPTPHRLAVEPPV